MEYLGVGAHSRNSPGGRGKFHEDENLHNPPSLTA